MENISINLNSFSNSYHATFTWYLYVPTSLTSHLCPQTQQAIRFRGSQEEAFSTRGFEVLVDSHSYFLFSLAFYNIMFWVRLPRGFISSSINFGPVRGCVCIHAVIVKLGKETNEWINYECITTVYIYF